MICDFDRSFRHFVSSTIVVTVFISMSLVLLSMYVTGSEARIAIVQGGNRIVSGNEYWSDTTVVLNENLTIVDGGNLTLDHVELKMNVTYDGQYHIEVQGGGAMYIYNSIITDGDWDNDTAPYDSLENNRYLFWVREQATFEMEYSELHECGYEWGNSEWGESGPGITFDLAGFLIEADSVIVYDNLMSHNFAGILLHYSNCSTISSNAVAYNDGDGIDLLDSHHNILTWNNVHHNYFDGIYLYNSTWNEISHNTATFNMNFKATPLRGNCFNIGLRESCYNTLQSCQSTDSFVHGILLDYGSCHNEVRSCIAKRNTEHGVLVRDSSDSNSISYCAVSDNDGDGICCENSSSLVINWNNIVDNTGYGVQNVDPTMIINAKYNWWGDPSGPSGVGPGTGDEVSDYVDYSLWLDKPIGIPVDGGIWVPVDKFGLLAPYIGLTSTILVATAATAICIKRVKHGKEK